MNYKLSVLHENDFGVGQLAVRLAGEIKKPIRECSTRKDAVISCVQGKFTAEI